MQGLGIFVPIFSKLTRLRLRKYLLGPADVYHRPKTLALNEPGGWLRLNPQSICQPSELTPHRTPSTATPIACGRSA
ncbi:protein of unknown function [Methylorubrum extorquens]|uniref:Uncharacterized protein n=1 Tax=Methylorubrum extorquens TaxID=408 RepID=A0A2N9AJW0_METEX|nr:protein of unknown function [Methylorubrum extorquens]